MKFKEQIDLLTIMCVEALSSLNQFLVWQERASLLRRFPNFKLIFSHQREK